MPRPESPSLRRDLAWTFVKLSGAVRDFTIDLTISRYRPDDVRVIRNTVQGVMRGILSIRPETSLFSVANREADCDDNSASSQVVQNHDLALRIVADLLANPTQALVQAMVSAISHCDSALANMVRHVLSSHLSRWYEVFLITRQLS